MSIKVQNEEILGAQFSPESENGPWVIQFDMAAPSPELHDWLMNPDGLASVEVDIAGVPNTGQARVNTTDIDFTLVGRGDLAPVAP